MSLEIIIIITLSVLLVLTILGLVFWFIRNKNKINQNTNLLEQNDQSKDHILFLQTQLNNIIENLNNIKISSDKITDVQSEVSSLSDIFKNNNQRGLAAEYTLELLLEDQFGNSNCLQKQYILPSNKRIDFYIKTNDGKGIGIDSKFPLENFKKINDGDQLLSIDKVNKQYKKDVIEMIRDLNKKYVATCDLDAVIMYVPSEAIFSKLASDDFTEVFKEAIKNNIYICSPTTLNIMIFFLFKSIKDFNLKQNIEIIIQHIIKLREEFNRWIDRYQELDKSINKLYETKSNLNITNEKIKKELGNIESKISG